MGFIAFTDPVFEGGKEERRMCVLSDLVVERKVWEWCLQEESLMREAEAIHRVHRNIINFFFQGDECVCPILSLMRDKGAIFPVFSSLISITRVKIYPVFFATHPSGPLRQ